MLHSKNLFIYLLLSAFLLYVMAMQVSPSVMALFTVNVGLRDQEVCRLKWEWEYYIPELDTSVFIIPGDYTKNGIGNPLILLEKIGGPTRT